MKNIVKTILSLAMIIITLFSVTLTAQAVEVTGDQSQKQVVFSDLDRLSPGESIEYVVIEEDGSQSTVGIKQIPTYSRTDSRVWQVWYRGIGAYVEFYMTVANNKVTSVYDYSISFTGFSYEDASLTKTSTYGKLTFTTKSIAGIVAGTCWLKGTVTGKDDQINVTWQM